MRPANKLKAISLNKGESLSLKPRPASFILKILMKNFEVGVQELSEKTGVSKSELEQILSGRRKLDKKTVVRFRRVFGKAVRPLLRVDRLYSYYEKTGNIHSGRGQIVVPKEIV
jgi:plasmid maintenance system antidote protein VapI